MTYFKKPLFLLICLVFGFLSSEMQASGIRTLFNSLDPYSVSQHLAFYELYPETKEGKAALKHAWSLLGGNALSEKDTAIAFPLVDIQAMISLITPSFEHPP